MQQSAELITKLNAAVEWKSRHDELHKEHAALTAEFGKKAAETEQELASARKVETLLIVQSTNAVQTETGEGTRTRL